MNAWTDGMVDGPKNDMDVLGVALLFAREPSKRLHINKIST